MKDGLPCVLDKGGPESVVAFLLEFGSDPNSIRLNTCSALPLAAKYGRLDVVKLLLDDTRTGIRVKPFNVLVAIMFAVVRDNADVLRYLLDYSVTRCPGLLQRDKLALIPGLQRSIRMNNPAIVEILLPMINDLECHMEHNRTPLSLAARYGNSETLQLLLEKGADPSSNKHGGHVPLVAAWRGRHVQVMGILLDLGVDPNARHNHTGLPLIFHAIRRRHKEIVQLLVTRNLDINITDERGKTALDLAISVGDNEILDLVKPLYS